MAKYKLGDIAPIQQGSVPESESYWLLNLDMVESNTGHIYERLYVPFDKIGTSTIAFDTNNVLYSKLRPYLNKVVIPDCPGYATSEMLPLKPNKNYITREYLTYFLRSPKFVAYINEKTSGAKMPRANSSDLKSVEIECPTLENQRHITSEFDRIISIVRLRQQQLQKLDELVKARFVEMFGNFVYERDRWSTCKIGDISDTIDPQPSHRTPPVSLDGIPYIGIAECNYKTLQIDFANARKVGQDVLQEHLNRYTLDKGDFIIGKIGTIGKPFFLPVKQTYTLSANTVLIKPNKLRVEPQFLFAVFQSEYMERIIDAEKKSTSQPAFGIQKVRKIDIPMPPLGLQQQFAAFVEQANKSKVTVQKALDEAQLLFDSLMQKYFG